MAGSDRWYFSKQQLLNSPSRKCGIDADKELSYRQQAANLIQDIGQRLTVTQLCINTGIVYMHRFYTFHSFTKFHRNAISACALFLAAKVEEQPRKLEHVIKVSHNCLVRDNQQQTPFDTKSKQYQEQAQALVMHENLMLQTLGFNIGVEHPHRYVVNCCQLVRASKDLAQTSYFMATNSLHLTTMCLQHKPTVVACVVIHLACKWSNWEIPISSEGKEWFYYVDPTVTPELLEQLTSEFLAILDKCPSRLKRRILSNTSNNSNVNVASMSLAHTPIALKPEKEEKKSSTSPAKITPPSKSDIKFENTFPIAKSTLNTTTSTTSSSITVPSPLFNPLKRSPSPIHSKNNNNNNKKARTDIQKTEVIGKSDANLSKSPVSLSYAAYKEKKEKEKEKACTQQAPLQQLLDQAQHLKQELGILDKSSSSLASINHPKSTSSQSNSKRDSIAGAQRVTQQQQQQPLLKDNNNKKLAVKSEPSLLLSNTKMDTSINDQLAIHQSVKNKSFPVKNELVKVKHDQSMITKNEMNPMSSSFPFKSEPTIKSESFVSNAPAIVVNSENFSKQLAINNEKQRQMDERNKMRPKNQDHLWGSSATVNKNSKNNNLNVPDNLSFNPEHPNVNTISFPSNSNSTGLPTTHSNCLPSNNTATDSFLNSLMNRPAQAHDLNWEKMMMHSNEGDSTSDLFKKEIETDLKMEFSDNDSNQSASGINLTSLSSAFNDSSPQQHPSNLSQPMADTSLSNLFTNQVNSSKDISALNNNNNPSIKTILNETIKDKERHIDQHQYRDKPTIDEKQLPVKFERTPKSEKHNKKDKLALSPQKSENNNLVSPIIPANEKHKVEKDKIEKLDKLEKSHDMELASSHHHRSHHSNHHKEHKSKHKEKHKDKHKDKKHKKHKDKDKDRDRNRTRDRDRERDKERHGHQKDLGLDSFKVSMVAKDGKDDDGKRASEHHASNSVIEASREGGIKLKISKRQLSTGDATALSNEDSSSSKNSSSSKGLKIVIRKNPN